MAGRGIRWQTWKQEHGDGLIENWRLKICYWSFDQDESRGGRGGFDRIDKINRISLNKGVSGLRSAQGIDGKEDRD